MWHSQLFLIQWPVAFMTLRDKQCHLKVKKKRRKELPDIIWHIYSMKPYNFLMWIALLHVRIRWSLDGITDYMSVITLSPFFKLIVNGLVCFRQVVRLRIMRVGRRKRHVEHCLEVRKYPDGLLFGEKIFLKFFSPLISV